MSFCWATNTRLGLLVMPLLGFKARVSSLIHTFVMYMAYVM